MEPGEGTNGGVRNPHTNMATVGKTERTINTRSSQGTSHSHAQNLPNGFDVTIVVVDVFGQKVVRLPITSEKTVWDTRKMNKGIYIYRFENNEKLYTGKIVIQ